MALCALGAAPAASQLLTRQLDATPESFLQLQREGPWLRVCEARAEGEHCRYEQISRASGGDQTVLMILPPPPAAEARAPAALIGVPLEVALAPGLRLNFDGGEPIEVGFRSCNPAGCLASIVLDGVMRRLVAQSSKLDVVFVSKTGQPATASFSLSRSAAILEDM